MEAARGAARRPLRAAVVALAGLLLVAGCALGSGTTDPADRPVAGPTTGAGATPTTDPAPGPRITPRPNVLVIEADDMRTDDLRFMPRTRRLIGETGLIWRNAFAGNPLCCPSRASFLTGQLSHNHRVLSHEDPYGFGSFDDRRTLATALQRAGYRTALVGKYLNRYGEQPTTSGAPSLRYVPPGWTQWYGSSDHLWQPGDRFAGGTYDYFRLTSNVNGKIRSWPGRYTTVVTAEQTRGLVRRFESGGDDPWFLWWTPVAPHFGTPVEPDDPGVIRGADGSLVNWTTPARPGWVKGRFDDEVRRAPGIPPHSSPEADRSDKPYYIRRQREFLPVELEAYTEAARQRAESLAVLDNQVARTLEALRATGAAEDTLVVFTSDNGFYMGEHVRRQGKIQLHEPSIRVPLLMTGAGVPRGVRFDPISTVDLAATLARITGARLVEPDGRDLRDAITGGDRGWLHPVLLESRILNVRYERAGDRSRLMRGLNDMGLRLGRYKFVRYATGETEVYDLVEDPLELESIPRSSRPVLVRRLERVWLRYANCRGAACTEPLPRGLQVTPAENRRITRDQWVAEREYFGR